MSAVRPLPDGLADRMDLAAEVFADKGLDATRIEHVAQATGIPRATLYYYFPGKEHILAHLLSRMLRQMTGKLAAAVAAPGNGRDRLARLVREHLVFIGEHGATYRLLFAELGRAGSLVDIAAGVDRAVMSPIRLVILEGQADGSLRFSDLTAATSMVYGAVLATGLQYLFIDDGQSLEELSESLILQLLTGLGSTRSAGRPKVTR